MANTKKQPISMPPLDAKAIGGRIRRARKTYNWNLYDLERIAGIRRSTIACYECGARVPIRDNVVRLALALRRTVDFLLLGRRDARSGK